MNRFHELSIELTQKCVLKCIYCSSEAGIEREEKLEFERLLKIIKEAKSFKVDTISLSGGEFFLYPDFLKLFNCLKENGIKIVVYTSGITLDDNGENSPISREILKKLKIGRRNPKIIVNIQGYNKNTIEKINGVPGSFKIIKESIKNIKHEKIFLGANVVPFKENFKNMHKIYDFCVENNFNQINFLRFVPQGRGQTSALNLTLTEFKEMQDELIKLLKTNKKRKEKIDIRMGHPINFLFLLNQKDLYKKEKVHYCRGGIDAPLILPNGDVAMCPAWKNLRQFNAGNIYEQSFQEIWNSKNFHLFRDFIKSSYKRLLAKPCKSCRFLYECRGKCVAQRLLAQGDDIKSLSESIVFAPDPQCFKDLVGY